MPIHYFTVFLCQESWQSLIGAKITIRKKTVVRHMILLYIFANLSNDWLKKRCSISLEAEVSDLLWHSICRNTAHMYFLENSPVHSWENECEKSKRCLSTSMNVVLDSPWNVLRDLRGLQSIKAYSLPCHMSTFFIQP